ncbi:hypothetical protein B0J14DRAFT_606019 [Halenospora varia]|nr:hypothetical protein B0J14DRAFT_606019 [Halenospora varia]
MNMHVPGRDIPRSPGTQIGGLERPFPVTLPQLPILNPSPELEYGSIPSTPRLQPHRRFSVLRPPLPLRWASINSQEENVGDPAVSGSEQDDSIVDSTIDSGGTDDNVEDEYGGEYPNQDDLFGDEPSPSESSDHDSASSSLAISETQNAVNPHEVRRDSQWLDVETPVDRPQVADTPVMFTPVIGRPVVSSHSSEAYNKNPTLKRSLATLSSEERSGDNTSFAVTSGVQSAGASEHEWEQIGDRELDSDFKNIANRDEAIWSAPVRQDTDREMVRHDLEEEIEKVFERNTGSEALENQMMQSGGSMKKPIPGNKKASKEKDPDHARIPDDQVERWYAVAKATTKSATAGKLQDDLCISGITQTSADPEIVEEPPHSTQSQPQGQDRKASGSRPNPPNSKPPPFPQPGRYLREQAPSPDTPIKEQFSSNTPPPTSSPTLPAIPELVLPDPAHAGLPPKLNPDPTIAELPPKRNPGKISLPALDFPEKSSGLKEPRPSVWGLTVPESPVVEKSAFADAMEDRGLNGTEFNLATFKADASPKRQIGKSEAEEGTPTSPTAKPTIPGPSQTSVAVPIPTQPNLLLASTLEATSAQSKRKRRRISKEVEMLADQTGLDGGYWAAGSEKRKRQRRGE